MKLNKKGFTLIELLAVIVVISLVIGLSTYGMISAYRKSKEKAMVINESSIKKAASIYSKEATDNDWKNIDSPEYDNYEFFCTTLRQLKNKGLIKKNVSSDNIDDNNYILVKRNKTTKAEEDIIIADNSNEEFTVCTEINDIDDPGEIIPGLYTISYDNNGGTNSIASQQKEQDININLSSSIPSRSGYIFLRWNTKRDGSGQSYNPGDVYTKNESVTLYAIWDEVLKPTIIASDGIESGSWHNNSYDLELSSSQDNVTYKYGEGSCQNATSNVSGNEISVSKTTATNVYYVKACIGSSCSQCNNYTSKVDADPPVIAITPHRSGATQTIANNAYTYNMNGVGSLIWLPYNISLEIEITDSGSGLSSATEDWNPSNYSDDSLKGWSDSAINGAKALSNYKYTRPISSDGNRWFKIDAADEAGNTSSKTIYFKTDTSTPTVTYKEYKEGWLYFKCVSGLSGVNSIKTSSNNGTPSSYTDEAKHWWGSLDKNINNPVTAICTNNAGTTSKTLKAEVKSSSTPYCGYVTKTRGNDNTYQTTNECTSTDQVWDVCNGQMKYTNCTSVSNTSCDRKPDGSRYASCIQYREWGIYYRTSYEISQSYIN